MIDDDILYLSDLNLTDFTRERARWDASNEIIECGDLLLTRSANPSPVTNVAALLNRGKDMPAAEVLDRINSFYSKYDSSFSVHIRKHVDADLESECRKAGMYKISDSPGMMISEIIPEKPLPENLEIQSVENASGAADFASVVTQSYQQLGLPTEIAAEIFRSFETQYPPLQPFGCRVFQGQSGNVCDGLLRAFGRRNILGWHRAGRPRTRLGRGGHAPLDQ